MIKELDMVALDRDLAEYAHAKDDLGTVGHVYNRNDRSEEAPQGAALFHASSSTKSSAGHQIVEHVSYSPEYRTV